MLDRTTLDPADAPEADGQERDETAALLAGMDDMSTRRPVAAQIIAVTSSDTTDARELAQVLIGDARLAGRVMKLANSAHFGMSGRVTSLQLAIAVVGFTTVRTLATVTLTDSTDETELPADFWDVGTGVALAASALAPRFGEYAPDALCLGLLSQVGAALLHHHDPAGYRALVEETPDFTRRRGEEKRRYGMSSVQLSAAALERWGFHESMAFPMHRLDDRTSPRGALLRAAFEVVARLTVPDRERVPIAPISCGKLGEEDLSRVLYDVRESMADLRGMFRED